MLTASPKEYLRGCFPSSSIFEEETIVVSPGGDIEHHVRFDKEMITPRRYAFKLMIFTKIDEETYRHGGMLAMAGLSRCTYSNSDLDIYLNVTLQARISVSKSISDESVERILSFLRKQDHLSYEDITLTSTQLKSISTILRDHRHKYQVLVKGLNVIMYLDENEAGDIVVAKMVRYLV